MSQTWWGKLLVLLGVALAGGWAGTSGVQPPGSPLDRPAYDLVVYGATPQGLTAAMAAAREGLRVLLVEPGSGVGGVLTQGYLATLDIARDAKGQLLQGGLFAEFYRRVGKDPSFDIAVAERELRTMLVRAGVELRLGYRLRAVQGRAGRVERLSFQGPGGDLELSPPRVVDASDTAALAYAAGARFTLGRADTGLDARQMAATLGFRLEGVPWGGVFLALNGDGIFRRSGAGAWGHSGWGLAQIGDRYPPSDPGRFRLRGLNLARQDDGALLVNALLVYGVDPDDPQALARARDQASREAPRVLEHLRHSDFWLFGSARLSGVAPQLYIRESRHLVGLYRLRADDVLYGQDFPDAVALGAYTLDGQTYFPGETPYLLGTPNPYGVPFRTLVPQGFANLLVVSQAASFDSVAAFSARVVPLQMALGQAAGIAAAVARARALDFPGLAADPPAIRQLRQQLAYRGARLRAARFPAPDDRSDPGYPAAIQLLRRGLFSAPSYDQGGLYLREPMLLGDFLADLEHFYRARKPGSPQLRTVLEARRRSARSLQRPLSREQAGQILERLAAPEPLRGEGPTVSRGEMARVLWRLVQPYLAVPR